jgi:L-alanine-DL-glutamate epimerase-like enolase superfamily enzyme
VQSRRVLWVIDALWRIQVTIAAVEREELRRGDRWTTLVRLLGDGAEGWGEDVTHDSSDRHAFGALDLDGLVGTWTLGDLGEILDGLEALGAAASWPVVRAYRRWAIESAALDLALRQAGTDLSAVLGLKTAPVSVVVSMRVDDPAPVLRLLHDHPATRLKLDARSLWTEATLQALVATERVDVIDLKGTAPGSSVHELPGADRYQRLAAAFPDAIFEDPVPALAELLPRIAWDEPIHGLGDLDALPAPHAVNVKPCRIGSLTGTLELIEHCRDRGIALYGGGHSEIGPGRGQAQLLAALFYPDGPNDIAPDPLRTSPISPPVGLSGFRWESTATR